MKKIENLVTYEKQILAVFIIAVLLYGVSVFFGDVEKLRQISTLFDWRVIPIVLILTLVNYLLRSVRFHFLLTTIKVRLSFIKSLQIFCAGIAMTVTPGKMGEIIKAYFVKQDSEVSYAKLVPILIMERLTDGIAMIFLSIPGLYFFPQGRLFFFFATVCVGVGIIFLMGKTHIARYLHTHSLSFMPQKIRYFLVSFFDNSYGLLTFEILGVSIFLGIIAWLAEGLGLFLIMKDFIEISSLFRLISYALLIFSFSSIAGFLVLIPGGIGVAEGSLTSLLIMLFHVTLSTAIFATLVFRLTTLWFGVAIGLIFLIRTLKEHQ